MLGPSIELLQAAERELPDTLPLQQRCIDLDPITVSLDFPAESTVPIAAVCLADAGRMMQEGRYALRQARAHLEHWRLATNEPAAVWHCQFYVADAALRLYAGGEHIAEGIVSMLSIPQADLATHRKGVSSRQAVVGRYMHTTQPAHDITVAINRLRRSADW